MSAGLLRCHALDGRGRKCGGPCGAHPVPVGATVVFLRNATQLPKPDDLDGNIWAACKVCRHWNVYRIVIAALDSKSPLVPAA